MNGPAKISVSLPIELKIILTVIVFSAACVETYSAAWKELTFETARTCIWGAALSSMLYTGLKYIFRLFAGKKAAVFSVSASALLLAFLLGEKRFGMLAVIVYLLWLFLQFVSDKLPPMIVICVFADAVMIFTYFAGGVIKPSSFTGKVIFAALFALNAAVVKGVMGYGKEKEKAYPFVYFLAVFVFLLFMPAKKDPIDWNPVINAAGKVVEKTKDMAQSVSYYFSDIRLGPEYLSGYNSLVQNGNSVFLSERCEVILRTIDNTTFTYTDEKDGKDYRRRRAVYLTGGRMADHEQLLDVLFSFYVHDVDVGQALLFSRPARLDVTYEYLKTRDEILPVGTMKIVDYGGKTVTEPALKAHKKGYSIRTDYFDLDYGSPYLERLIASPEKSIPKSSVNLKMLSIYTYETMGINLKELVSEEEYKAWQEKSGPSEEYLDISGTTERMKELASEITEGFDNEYEKCRATEAYLRRYKYRTDTGISGKGDTGSAQGMSLMADDFLFETGEGYCVHYASAMVMLLRLNGIPARTVSGYRYVFPYERQSSYEVLGANAHVWPEAYISGFGWVGFEPTTVYATAADRTWHRHPAAQEEEEYTGVNEAALNVPYPTPALPVSVIEDEKESDDNGNIMEAVKILVIIISAVILMAVLLFAGTKLFKAVRYRRADSNGRLMMDVGDMTMIIRSSCAMPYDDRGVMSDYLPFIPESYAGRAREIFETYYRIRYRNGKDGENKETVSEEEEAAARELKNGIRNEYKNRRSRKKK